MKMGTPHVVDGSQFIEPRPPTPYFPEKRMKKKSPEYKLDATGNPIVIEDAYLERLDIVGKCYGIARKDNAYVAIEIELGSPGYQMRIMSDFPERFFDAKRTALTELSYTEDNQ